MGLSKSDQQFVDGSALMRQSLCTSLIAAFATALLLMFLISGGNATAEALIIGLFFAAFGGVLTFQILRSGKVNRRRLIIFLLVALFFGTVFSIEHQVHRGSILLTSTQIESADVPICPITIPFVIPPLVIRGEMIFPASVRLALWIGLFWLGMALIFGRGWCGAGSASLVVLTRHAHQRPKGRV